MSTSPENDNRDDPENLKLPPTSSGPKAGRLPKIPTAGVSPKLRFFVIGLTFFTVMVFGVFVAMFIKKAYIKNPETTWGPQLLTIAEELKDRGLKPQAIEQYQKFLDTQKVNQETRSRISFDIGKLYVELGQCDDAVVWFLHAKAAQPTAPRIQETEAQVEQCRSRLNTSQ